MKKRIVYCMALLLFGTTCFARDFIVQFVDENYKETQSSFSYLPVIYHSVQVSSQAGPKLLILKGEDYHYRNWVRQYIAKGKAFVVKIPDDRVDLFITSSAFEMDVTDVHPINFVKYQQGEKKYKNDPDREDFYKNSYGLSSKSKDDLKALQNQEIERKKRSKEDLLKKDKTDKDAAKKLAVKNKQLAKQKELSKKLAARELEKKQALEKKREKAKAKELENAKKEKEKRLAQLAAQKAVEEENRRQELELRWLELKKRLLNDERIKNLDQTAREQELNRRWLELKQKFDIQ